MAVGVADMCFVVAVGRCFAVEVADSYCCLCTQVPLPLRLVCFVF